MSNYPDGVTGFEPQIAGYPEIDLHDVECVGGWVDTPDGPDSCDWSGDLPDTPYTDYGVAWWNCPRCGTYNETELDDGEPDYEPYYGDDDF